MPCTVEYDKKATYRKDKDGSIYIKRNVGNSDKFICIKSDTPEMIGGVWCPVSMNDDRTVPVYWNGNDFIASIYYKIDDDLYALIGSGDDARLVCLHTANISSDCGAYFSNNSTFGISGKECAKPVCLDDIPCKLTTGTRYKRGRFEYIVRDDGKLQGYLGDYGVGEMCSYAYFTHIEHKPRLGDVYYRNGDYLIVCGEKAKGPQRLAVFMGPNAGLWVSLDATETTLYIGRVVL